MRSQSFSRRSFTSAFAAVFCVQSACSSVGFDSVAQHAERSDSTTAPYDPKDAPEYPRDSIVPAKTKITLSGSSSVTDEGAATYSLPLWVPDGPQDTQPSLTLSYRGGGGNGHLGTGFTLSGLSAISPCAQRFASEGRADGVDFDATDAYCLDGAKLVEIVDPDYPASGTARVYHTEVERFARIVAKLDPTRPQPTGFTVFDSDGRKHVYGPRYASRFHGLSEKEMRLDTEREKLVAYIYLLELSEDVNGNRIAYTYEDADSAIPGEVSYRVSSISYAFGGTVFPQRAISFQYDPRPDPVIRYSNGIKLVNRSVLRAVHAWAPNPTAIENVWSYFLRYEVSPDTQTSRLQSLKLCGASGACSYERRFSWTTSIGKPFHLTTLSNDVELDDYSLSRSDEHLDPYTYEQWEWVPPTDVRVMLFDVDSDGDDDALYRTRPTSVLVDVTGPEGEPKANYACSAGTIRLRRTGSAGPLAHMSDVGEVLEDSGYLGSDGCPAGNSYPHSSRDIQIAYLGKSRVMDLDGDGRLDLHLAKAVIERDHEVMPNGDVFAGEWRYGFQTSSYDSNGWSFPADLAQEVRSIYGPATIATWDDSAGVHEYVDQLMMFDPPFQRVFADLDGDARPEPVDAIRDVNVLDHPASDWSDPFVEHGDLHEYETQLSNSGADLSLHQDWACGNGRARVVDLDGDGRNEMLTTHADDGEYRALGTNDGLDAEVTVSSALWAGKCGAEVENNPDLVMGDWNGDGLVDALYPPGSHHNNAAPLVRWNLGTGFSPLEAMPVSSNVADLRQDAPLGRSGNPVPWDRGTRVADVNNDGRADIVAFRQHNSACIDIPLQLRSNGLPHTFACDMRMLTFLSTGSGFAFAGVHQSANAGASLAMGFTTSQIGDVTGDGAVDAVYVAEGKLKLLELPWRWSPDRLAAVHDELTPFALDEFEYTRSWWGAALRPGTRNCPFPLACNYRGFEVVRTHRTFAGTRPDATPMHRTFVHTYQDFGADQQGRGSLGVGEHRIWDRERGVETIRVFDHEKPHDPVASSAGGRFYPGSREPVRVLTITPLKYMPTAAELSTPTMTPGLGGIVTARLTKTTREQERRASTDGRILTVLTRRLVTQVADVSVTLDPSAEIPHYGSVALPEQTLREETTIDHDAYGYAEHVVTTGTGGKTTVRDVEYQHDTGSGVWRLGGPTRIAEQSYDSDDVERPTQITRTIYDALGRPDERFVSAQAEDGTTLDATAEKLGYDAFGNLTSTTLTAAGSPHVRTVAFHYDAAGVHPTAKTDESGATHVTLIHPALGVPVFAQGANGLTAHATYDTFGRVLSVAQQGQPTVSFDYTAVVEGDQRGFAQHASTTDGGMTYRRFDELGREVGTGARGFDGTWSYWRDEVDPLGQVVAQGDAFVNLVAPKTPTLLGYDRLGRLLRTTRADGAIAYSYYPTIDATALAQGELETVHADAEQHMTFVASDLAGRVIRSGSGSSATSYGALSFTHGAFDRVERIVDSAGNETVYGHDLLGRNDRLVDPDAGETSHKYNGFGELIEVTKATGESTTMEYDVMGRLFRTTSVDGVLEREYGTQGGALHQVIREVSPDDVEVRTDYDTFGRPITIRQTIDGITDRIDQAYDAQGRLAYRFYPEAIGYQRFALRFQYSPGHLYAIDDVSACGLNPANPVFGSCAPTTIWEVLARDAEGRLHRTRRSSTYYEKRDHDPVTGLLEKLSVTHGSSSSLLSMTFSYDHDDLLETRTEDSRVETFEHDTLHRLTEWTLNDKRSSSLSTTAYDYDPLGNLLSVTRNGSEEWSGDYGHGGRPHALQSTKRKTASGTLTATYDYDANGRQTLAGTRTTAWTAANKPRELADVDGWAHSYRYGAANERAVDVTDKETVTYVGKLYERRANEGSHTFLIHGEGAIIAQMRYADGKARLRHIVSDALQSALLEIHDDGTTARSYFAPFGARVGSDGEPTTDADRTSTFGYTGHEEDERELVNMNGRLYDLAQYRFISPDPIIGRPLFGQNRNPYNYVMNSPLYYNDPSGFNPPDTGWQPGGDGGGTGQGAGFDGTGYQWQPDQDDTSANDGGVVCINPGCGGGGGGDGIINADAPSATPRTDSLFTSGLHDMDVGTPVTPWDGLSKCYKPEFLEELANEQYRERAAQIERSGTIGPIDERGRAFKKWLDRGVMMRQADTGADGLYLWMEYGPGPGGGMAMVGGKIANVGGLAARIATAGKGVFSYRPSPLVTKGFRPNVFKRNLEKIKSVGRGGLPPLKPGQRPEVGHVPGFEASPLSVYGAELKMSRRDLTEFVNLYPENFFIQSNFSNSRHATDLGELHPYWKEQMRKFMKLKYGK